ncbi:hypothetical protein WA026_022429 [Henosepilachna vigintioctopunctata]|uniref:CUB domain-containing protein n=1 Tax=Henosepilachna vigintioctopunctata TaxID=420089 RepID=A0AAW1U493_9CUCU
MMKYLVILITSLSRIYADMHAYNWNNNMYTDYSDETVACINGTLLSYFIPYGTGVSSSQVSMLTNQFVEGNNPLDCMLEFRISKTSGHQVQIIVVEYVVNNSTYDEIMTECRSANKGEYLQLRESVPGSQVIHVCDEFKPSKHITPVFIHVSDAEIVTLHINPKGNTCPMKVTVSAGRRIDRHDECLLDHEIPCFIEKELICLQNRLACDGNINCGIFDDKDEDYRVCMVQDLKGYWFTVLVGITLVIGVYIIFIYLIKSYIPKISDNFFVFDEDKENKLMLRSQLNSHIWRKPKKVDEEDVFCVCQEVSDTTISIFSD